MFEKFSWFGWFNRTILQARQGLESEESGSDDEKDEAAAKPQAAEHEESNESEEESSEEEEGEVELFLFSLETSFAYELCLFCVT